MTGIHVEVRTEPLSVDALLALAADPTAGGTAVFIGTVRDHTPEAPGAVVTGLEYEAHPEALARLREVAEKVAADHDVIALAAEHRVGPLEVGDAAVVVVASAAHRAQAFAACRALIDTLKAEVPIWKREGFADGSHTWVGV
ncbi:MAG TPA: molybdenum cofactor biosynthesis protein MoaE [Actinospica sp.]|nr:molybdenum cofactor biosynthesis protein MoaE [Actinospica sp.]